ncbi:MAG: competence/damage-inducible protein A [Candidatus Omnitrophica bacterium]|nr:competence/damage-inducible protein A [Candidatus Omnitrophota bacterium]
MAVMQAEIIAIGSELLSGRVINTNAAYLSRQLQALGIAARRHLAVPDEPAAIVEAITAALHRSDLILITGGLGPTDDDITVQALARALGQPLVRSSQAARHVQRLYRRHGAHLSRLAARQAFVPRGARPLPNPLGTAPGVWWERGATRLIALPGVPQEMRAILQASVLPRLRRLRPAGALATRTIRTIGVLELQLQRLLRRFHLPPGVSVGFYPNLLMVDVQLTATSTSARRAAMLLDGIERRLHRALGRAIYAVGEPSLEAVAGESLVRHRATVAIAESCTGGLVSTVLTEVPGSSRYVTLSVVAYHNQAKIHVLGVAPALLARHGAVSAPVARAMAEGARRLSGSTFGVSVTGIAGPGGGTADKPVGLVYLAWAGPQGTQVARKFFYGDRAGIRRQAAQLALNGLRLAANALTPSSRR